MAALIGRANRADAATFMASAFGRFGPTTPVAEPAHYASSADNERPAHNGPSGLFKINAWPPVGPLCALCQPSVQAARLVSRPLVPSGLLAVVCRETTSQPASQPAGTDASRLEWPVFHRSIWTCRAVAGVSSPKRALVSGGRAPAYKAAGSHAKTNRPASKLAPAWAEIRFMFSHCRDKLKRGAPLCWVG